MDRRYLINRVGQAIITLWAVLTLTFGMIRYLPGDPETFAQLAGGGSGGGVPDEALSDYNYGQGPVLEEYADFMLGLFRGDLGHSVYFERPVADILVEAVPWTVFLVTSGLILTFLIGITLGAFLAYYENTRLDHVISTTVTVLNAVPFYIAAVLLVYVLGYQSDLFPRAGRAPQGVDPGLSFEFIFGVLHHGALPIFSIVITAFGFTALSMRGNSIQVLGTDYVRVARLRGIPDNRIALQYVGRNAVLPIYTGLMIAIGALLGGSVILEFIFEYRGLGYYFFTAISARDYPLMMGSFLVIVIVMVLGLFIADLTYGLIDPRASTGDERGSNENRASFRVQLANLVGSLRRVAHNMQARLTGNQRRASPAELRRQGRDAQGGQSLFETTSEVTRTRRERLRRSVNEYVIAPLIIIWQDTRAKVGALIILFYLLVGTVGVWLVEAPESNQGPRNLAAFQDLSHPLGTDTTGQSLLSLTVHATNPMLEMMIAGALFAIVIATTIGIFAGYSGGRIDRILMTICDIALSIPGLPLVMVMAVLLQPTEPWAVGVLLTINAWGGAGRQIRSQVLVTASESYIEASDIMSLPRSSIMVKDILPNLAPFIAIRFVQLSRQVIVSSVALYFLGVLPFTQENWGVTLNMAYNAGALYTFQYAHWILIPTIAIVVIIYGLIMFSQGTDRIFNVRVRAKHIDTGDEPEPEPEPEEPPGPAPSMDD